MLLPLTIESINHEGRGIARINGKTIFIEGALPNETITFRYTRRHPRFDEGVVTEILQPSSERVIPPCEFFNICNGCQLQHMPVDLQIQFKQQALAEQLQQVKVTPEQWLTPLVANPWHYRYKGRLSVKYVHKKQSLLVGFHEKSGRFIADMTNCQILHPKVAALIAPLRHDLRQLSIYQQIPQIEITVSEPDQVTLMFRHLADFNAHDQHLLKLFAEKHQLQIYLQPNPPAAVHCLYPTENPLPLFYKLKDFDLSLQFTPQQFIQINPVINQLMVKQAIEWLAPKPNDQVLDLFCGIGNFTLPLAKYSQSVTGVEAEASAIEQARINATLNQLAPINFYCANLFKPQTDWTWLNQTYDKVLLDPPRTGALEILPWVLKWQAKKIVYVSCNPATLARDAGILVNQYGYKLTYAGVMDMFPHTRHVESMALFVKG